MLSEKTVQRLSKTDTSETRKRQKKERRKGFATDGLGDVSLVDAAALIAVAAAALQVVVADLQRQHTHKCQSSQKSLRSMRQPIASAFLW